MGHYLSEMEDDGVPGNWKLGRSSEPRKRDKHPILKCVCTRKEIEASFGVTLTWAQVDEYLDAMEAREPAMRELCAEHARQRRVIYADALLAVLGSDMPAQDPALSRDGRGE